MAEQWVEIKPFKVMFIIDSFPGGCAPLDVQVTVSVVGQSSPITHCMWIWNSDDTTYTNFGFANYTYTDSGVYEPKVIVTNKQGCLAEDTKTMMIGFKPVCNWTSTPTQNCKSQFRLPVYAYDSLDADSNLVGDAPANNWIWYRDGKDVTVDIGNYNNLAFRDTGLITYASLVCYHYYCPSDNRTKSIQAYVCPPIARIDSISYPYMSINYNPYLHPNCNKFLCSLIMSTDR